MCTSRNDVCLCFQLPGFYDVINLQYAIVTYLSRSSVAFLGKGNVTDSLVVWVHLEVTAVGDVVEVLYVLPTNTSMHIFVRTCKRQSSTPCLS